MIANIYNVTEDLELSLEEINGKVGKVYILKRLLKYRRKLEVLKENDCENHVNFKRVNIDGKVLLETSYNQSVIVFGIIHAK